MKLTYLRYAVIAILPLALYLGSSMYYQQTYYARSLEWMDLCLQHVDQTSVCSHLTFAADRSFNLATAHDQPVLIMLVVAVIGFAVNNVYMRKELNELKEMLDD